ncbi:MAG: type II secretion system protein GspC [Gammaproteobacteria bacterium]|nr:MAG: type II secretion system protein GspC [Gammaproteobacteria bacterium]
MRNPLTETQLNRLHRWAPVLLSVVFVLLLAWQLTQIIWRLTGATAPVVPPPPPAALDAPSAGPHSQALALAQRIAERHLFGEAPAVADSGPVDAPETQLNLKLIGVLALGEDEGVALIASGNDEEKIYKVGDRLPGNAVLKAVYLDRVLLETARGLETLKLPKDEPLIDFAASGANTPAGEPAYEPPPSPMTGAPPPQSAAPAPRRAPDLAAYRREFIRDPQAITRIARITPEERDGRFVGYRVSPNEPHPLFDALGLQDGDVITGVNGVQFERPEDGLRVLRDLMHARSVEVTVLRNGETLTFRHDLGP